jgi:hypothetical protein
MMLFHSTFCVTQMKGQLQLTSVFTTLTFAKREIIEFAPCRLPQSQNEFVDSGKRHGVNTPDVIRQRKRRNLWKE